MSLLPEMDYSDLTDNTRENFFLTLWSVDFFHPLFQEM